MQRVFYRNFAERFEGAVIKKIDRDDVLLQIICKEREYMISKKITSRTIKELYVDFSASSKIIESRLPAFHILTRKK